MDPVCHTLVGAALGRAGLARRTALGMAALMVGANLPDIDLLASLSGPAGMLAFRRGWTHGVLALLVLPALLTGGLLIIHQLGRRASRSSLPSMVRPGALLLLSYIAVLTHPLLDWMNTYGVRLLMPFSDRWFYGDTLFIVDPWVWLALFFGVYFGRRRRTKTGFRVYPRRPATIALGGVAVYVALMAISGRVAERIVRREVQNEAGAAVDEVMTAPRPITPFARRVVVARGDRYLTGTFRWLGRPHLIPSSVREHARGYPADPDVLQALRNRTARRFLSWSRFPTFTVRNGEDGRPMVHIVDLRYVGAPGGFGTLSVPVMALASAPPSDSLRSSSSAGRTAPAP